MPQPKIKEEERIEKIIRGLLKLPENKRCINCNSLGPQYVCTTFWTFVCTNCSGVHREFTHRVKSVSMAKFSADEVAALQLGGNEQARKTYFKTWDPQRNSFPDGSNLHRLRNFIRHVYVEGKYSGERNNDKVSLNKAGAKDDYSEQRSSENTRHVAREKFFERLSFERTDQARRDDIYDRRSFENFSPRNSDRSLRYYIEERSSPRYRQEKLKSASRRNRPANFEIVDDRFREDEIRSGRRFESNGYSDADSRARSSSPVSQKGRSGTCPPPVHPLKDNLGNNVPPLKLGEPPKANDVKNIECSTQVQKAAGSTSTGSTDKKEKNNIVNICNLIDFDANPEPPATTAVVQTQQNVPSSDGGNSSAPTSANDKASNTPNVNSMEFLLFELAGPTVAPCGRTFERPPDGDTPSAAAEGSLNTEAAITPGSTTIASLDSNYAGTTNASPVQNAPAFPHFSSHSVVTVTQAQQLPVMNQNQSLVPPGNDSSISLQTFSSVQSLYNQPLSSEPAHIKGPPTHVSSEQSSQDVSHLAQDTSSGNESVSRGRKELPADIFTPSHSSIAAVVPGWQSRSPYGMQYDMQYHTTAMASHDSVKSRNPFDLGDDGFQFQAAAFPSMSSLQGALPNTSASPGPWPRGLPYASADNSQGMSYGMMIPPGAYIGQQLPNNTMPSKPQRVNNAGDSADAFASLNPIQHSSGLNPASAEPNSYPSTSENPFG